MITLHGKLYNVASSNFTDRQSGEVTLTHTAEIIHQARGKSEILPLKIDASVLDQWTKFIGREMTVEVRSYAMKTREGGILSGYALADKTALPVVQMPPLKAAA